MNVIGECNLCGGMVIVPTIWYGMYPPVPYCRNCGATSKQYKRPIMEMEKPKTFSDQIAEVKEDLIKKFKELCK